MVQILKKKTVFFIIYKTGMKISSSKTDATIGVALRMNIYTNKAN